MIYYRCSIYINCMYSLQSAINALESSLKQSYVKIEEKESMCSSLQEQLGKVL